MTIRFRPHHFLCTVGFEGKGYNQPFIENFSVIANKLRSPNGDETEIEITTRTDSICEPCPHRLGTSCATEKKINQLDLAHKNALKLNNMKTIKWGEAKQRIKNHISLETFHSICDPCEWKKLGVCETALKKLNALLIAFIFVTPVASTTFAVIKNPPKDLVFQRSFSEDWERIHSRIRSKSNGEFARREIEIKITELNSFESQSPYLPIRQKQLEYRGALYILKGFQLYQNNRFNDSNAAFERGFEYLEKKGNWIRWNSPATLQAYSRGCDKIRSNTCISRLNILTSTFPKTSLEYKSIELGNWAKKEPTETSNYERITQQYKNSDADYELYSKIMGAIRTKDRKNLRDFIQQFNKEYPKSALKERVLLWDHIVNDGPILSTSEKPFSYFSLHSAELQKINLYEVIKKQPHNSTAISNPASIDSPSFSPAELFLANRIQELLKSKKLKDLARFDLRELKVKPKFPTPLVLSLARTQAQSGNIVDSFVAISEIFDRGERILYNQEGIDLVFPVQHWDTIQKVANEVQIDPVLILSLIKQESAFFQDAVSSSGALGMMQLMPFTASDTSSTTELRTLVDPATNIKVGSLYLKELLKRFNGNIALALAGYNAGPVAVDRWMKEFDPDHSLDFLTFVESIPYKETRNYVSGIARNYYWYSNILQQPTQVPMNELFWKSQSNTKR